jgi:hypothetical protein
MQIFVFLLTISDNSMVLHKELNSIFNGVVERKRAITQLKGIFMVSERNKV